VGIIAYAIIDCDAINFLGCFVCVDCFLKDLPRFLGVLLVTFEIVSKIEFFAVTDKRIIDIAIGFVLESVRVCREFN
jgi:hypothetical protein